MGTYGGLAPGAERYGGGNRRLQRILEALNRARGTAYDVSFDSNVYAENMAVARAIDNAWGTNQRLGRLADPASTSDVPRWERILGTVPNITATEIERRAFIVDRFARAGVPPTLQEVVDELTAALGPMFVAIHHLTPATAVTWWPGGTPNPDAPWYSTIAYIPVEVTQPVGMSDGEFVDRLSVLAPVLDGRLPAWVTWDWYVLDSSLALGFILDDPKNLDREAFDS